MSVTGPSGTPLLSLSETSGTVSFICSCYNRNLGISGTPSALTTQTTSFIYKLTTDGSSVMVLQLLVDNNYNSVSWCSHKSSQTKKSNYL